MFDAVLARSRAHLNVDEPVCALPELQFATAAALRIQQPAEGIDRSGLMTVLVGASGSGKSLLVRQSMRQLRTRRTRRPALAILTPEDWIQLQPEMDRPGFWEQWGSVCERLDVIAVENLDAVVTDPELGEHITAWLDRVMAHQVHVLITLSEPLGNCPQFPLRLANRLRGGLLARIPALSPASRREFLNWAAEAKQVSLSDDVLTWLIEQPPGSLRSLRQLLDRLLTEFSPPVRINNLADVQRLFVASTKRRLSLAVIASQVADEFGVPAQELRSSTRLSAHRVPRQCAMLLAHEVGGWPMTEIGRYFGRRTHTSVSYSCRKLQEALAATPSLRTQIQRLQSRLRDQSFKDCG